ncbi:MAG: protoheme IX farnesyltransferase, partial [Lysobacterales bacterium]
MRIVETSPSCVSSRSIGIPVRSVLVSRLFDYLELTKPRIAVLALIAVAVGYSLAASASWQIIPLLHALLGVGLVAASSSALNQLLERSVDSRMTRTANRPLPAGRMRTATAFTYGAGLSVIGTVYLWVAVNALASILAMVTLLTYLLLYTPLKSRTPLCTLIGAFPGAMPPLIGWAAVRGTLDL